MVRKTVHFDGATTTGPLWTLGPWAFGGLVVAGVAAAVRDRRHVCLRASAPRTRSASASTSPAAEASR